MKKILQVIIIMTLSLNAQAQIPNNSLENWTTVSTFEEPDDWATSNSLYYGLDLLTSGMTKTPTTVFKVTPGSNGTYAMKLKNVVDSINLFGTYYASDTVSAFAFTGFPYTQRPTNMNCDYQFNQGATFPIVDSAMIAAYFTKWNGSSQDTVGEGMGYITTNTSAYLAKNISINYFNATIPDSAWVFISSTSNQNSTPNPGTSIIVDGFIFGAVTAVKNTSVFGKDISFYPNPVLDEVNIKNIPSEASNIEIRDFTGKKVQLLEVTSDFINFKTNDLTAGMYIYSITNANGEFLYSDKFNIVK